MPVHFRYCQTICTLPITVGCHSFIQVQLKLWLYLDEKLKGIDLKGILKAANIGNWKTLCPR